MLADFVFNSESVTAGHPDKICDQISDGIVGQHLAQDGFARVEAEAAVSTGIVFLSVRASSAARVDAAAVARDVIRHAGYDRVDEPFSAQHSTVMTTDHELGSWRQTYGDEQQLDETGLDRVVAEDQATVFGYACDETSALMPLPILLARALTGALTAARRDGRLPGLSPDGKSQVGVEYRGGRPVRLNGVSLLVHERAPMASIEALRDAVRAEVLEPVFAATGWRPDDRARVWINPQGPRGLGGPAWHAGQTGRKTAVDTYGEFSRNSSSAMAGKDPARVERVGAWAARYAAVNVVAAGLASRCEVQLSYAVGAAAPISVSVDAFGTGRLDEDEISRRVRRVFDFRPAAMVRDLGLRGLARTDGGRLYRQLAAAGQVGRPELELPWERTDRVDALR